MWGQGAALAQGEGTRGSNDWWNLWILLCCSELLEQPVLAPPHCQPRAGVKAGMPPPVTPSDVHPVTPDAEAAWGAVHVCACVCVFMGMGACLVWTCMSLSLYPCKYVLVWGVGAGPRSPLPQDLESWPHLLQLLKMTEAESPWKAWKTRLKGTWGLSVCLSFGPRNESPPDLRAV